MAGHARCPALLTAPVMRTKGQRARTTASPISRMGHTSVEDGWRESSRPELLAPCVEESAWLVSQRSS
jgi:hypothetical protein